MFLQFLRIFRGLTVVFWYYFCNFAICKLQVIMIEVKIKDSELALAAGEGTDSFLNLIIEKTRHAIGGELNADNMPLMSSKQITLIGYATLRDEVMDGGFVQLIHNGYGPFFFRNLFDLAVKQWGLDELCRLMRKAKKLYFKYQSTLECEMTDEEFMAIYEQLPDFEDLDDTYITNEEAWTDMVAHYVDENLTEFITIEQ